ncbi:hypothetical protein OE88DRAFT_1811627 [Heliocybe sulcata]|uniref:Uncharacterized protein n=1 Tax=Heliocybe sulcata TaxID=5364 RepID=A0A5C3MZA0_9AGAM|nr:hypothetical protein OE88DRAFT_1811627 [Heliocybe sulcata]
MAEYPAARDSASHDPGMPAMTQSAASMLAQAKRTPFNCSPIDDLLGGGLRQGYIAELSGPPGTPKERLAVDLTKSVLKDGKHVLFVDMQNMVQHAALSEALQENENSGIQYDKQVQYLKLHAPAEVTAFMHNLPTYMDENPKLSLLVLNSLSFPFQSSSELSPATRQFLLERIKPILARTCAARNLSVVITTQLATKLIKEDGTSGNFDNGARAIMLPSLGNTYLPIGRTYRLLIVPHSRTSGVVRLLASPTTAGPCERQILDIWQIPQSYGQKYPES